MAAEPRIQQNYYVPITGGSTIPVNNLGTSAIQVLDKDPSRKTITFHNPNYDSSGGVDVLVSQAEDVNGNAINPSFASPGGSFIIFPGAPLTITDNGAQSAWKAVARSGASNGLTILTSK